MLAEIPNDSAAALVLIEHHWAVPLRDAIMRAGGFRLSDGFISPLDLVAIGLVSAAEAERAARHRDPPPSGLDHRHHEDRSNDMFGSRRVARRTSRRVARRR